MAKKLSNDDLVALQGRLDALARYVYGNAKGVPENTKDEAKPDENSIKPPKFKTGENVKYNGVNCSVYRVLFYNKSFYYDITTTIGVHNFVAQYIEEKDLN